MAMLGQVSWVGARIDSGHVGSGIMDWCRTDSCHVGLGIMGWCED